jgi:hypothetical protein
LTYDYYTILVLVLLGECHGEAMPSHARGHWFETSTAHNSTVAHYQEASLFRQAIDRTDPVKTYIGIVLFCNKDIQQVISPR